MSGCNDSPFDPTAEAHLNGRTETGVQNTLYALNQLSGDFFTRATRFRYVDMTQASWRVWTAFWRWTRGMHGGTSRRSDPVGFLII